MAVPSGRPGPSAEPDDDGFVLLESLITIALITVVMTALTTFFITAMSSTARQRSEQAATQIATSAVETVRGYGAARAFNDHDRASVTTQFGSALAQRPRVAPLLAEMEPAVDPRANPGRGPQAPVPTVGQPQLVNGITYGIDSFIGTCFRSGADGTDAECRRTRTSAAALEYVRAVVVVSWPDTTCNDGTCVFVTTTMLNATAEPIFDLRTTTPEALSLTCVELESAVGDELRDRSVIASAGRPGCTIEGGVRPYTYEITNLPDGVTAERDGVLSGTPTREGTRTVTVTVTDSYLTRTSTSFAWNVLPRLVVTPLPTQSNTVNVAIPPLTLAATGGAGAPYTWQARDLPPGLSLDGATGRVTGTPTTVGSYPTTITVTDRSRTRTAEYQLNWVISYPALVLTAPPDQLNARNDTVSLALAATGGSGSVVWTDPGSTLPAGLRIEGNRVVGRPTTLTSRQRVILTATDAAANTSRTVEFRWTVDNGALIIGNVGRQISTVDQRIAPLTLQVSGGSAPYTWSDPGNARPPGLGLSAGGVFSGTPTVVGGQRFTVTVTDTGGRSGTATIDWFVQPRPALNSPGDQQNPRGTDVSVQLASGCGNPPCRIESTGGRLPDGLSVDPTSARITGTPTVAGRYTGIVFTITDAAGATTSTTPITWTITNPALRFNPPQGLTTPKVSCDASRCQAFYSAPVNLESLTEGGDGQYGYSISVENGTVEPNPTRTSLRIYSSSRNAGERVTLNVRVTDGTGAVVNSQIVWTTR